MEITIGKLLEGKSTVIKEHEYLSTEEYVKPFIELMSKFTKDFSVQVQLPTQFTITNSKEDITYNRVWVQAVMPNSNDVCGYAETFNLVYALDVRKPVYKLFKAYKDRKTGNLFVFDSQWLSVYELKPGTAFIDFEQSIKNLMEMTDDSEIRFNRLNKEFLSSRAKDKQQKLGSLIENSMFYEYCNKGGKVKLAPAMVLKAFQNVYMDSSSRNYVSETEESSLFNYLDAFSTLVTQDSKDIVNRFEKSALALQILNEELWK